MKIPMNVTVEVLYDAYLGGNTLMQTVYDDILKSTSSRIDQKLEKKSITSIDLADYEYDACHADFYAGFKAALLIINM